MKTITIRSDNEQSIRKVRELAESLNMPVEEKTLAQKSYHKVTSILREWHRQGGIKTQIDNPVEWQKEQRRERDLPFEDK